MKILLIENDHSMAEIIKRFLVSKKHNVYTVFDGEEGENILYSNKFDLLILEANLPSVSGFEILMNLREIGDNTPAIFITSSNTALDFEEAYKSGCDDYIKKPFELKELEMRINYLKKIYAIASASLITIDNRIKFDTSNFSILKDEEVIILTKKEAQIIKYFLENKNKIINIDELILNIWEYDRTPTIGTIRTYLKNIRKIFGAEYITTFKGIGYRFNVDNISYL